MKTTLRLEKKRKIAKDEKLILKKLVEHNTYDEFTSIYVTNVYKKTHHPIILEHLLNHSCGLLKSEKKLLQHQVDYVILCCRQIAPSSLSKQHIFDFYQQCLSYCQASSIDDDDEEMNNIQTVALDKLSYDFFKPLPGELQYVIVKEVIVVASQSRNSDVLQAARKALKDIKIDAEYLVKEIELLMENGDVKGLADLLEILQNKKKIDDSYKMIGPLFKLLEQVEPNTNTENDNWHYVTQYAVTTLLNLFKRLEKNDNKQVIKERIKTHVNVQLLVRMTRSSHVVQICQQSLSVLACIAPMYPKMVVDTVMEIFTFMKKSMFQKDDCYTYELITKTIQTILPTLFGRSGDDISQEISILRTFVDSYTDIYAHRRSLVFKELLKTIGEEKYLAHIMLIFIDHSLLSNNEKNKSTESDWCQVCSLFEVETQLITANKLVEYVMSLSTPITQDQLNFKLSSNSNEHKRRVVLLTLTFVSNLLHTTRKLVQKKIKDEGNDLDQLSTSVVFNKLMKTCMTYMSALSSDDKVKVEKYHKSMNDRIHDLLTEMISLLPTRKFLELISSLLEEQSNLYYLNNSLKLFNKQIVHVSLDDKETDALVELCKKLIEIFMIKSKLRFVCVSGINKQNTVESVTTEEVILSCAISIKHIFKCVNDKKKLDEFAEKLPKICQIATSCQSREKVVMSCFILIGEIITKLLARCLKYLNHIVPCFCKYMDFHMKEEGVRIYPLNILLQTIYKLFTTLPFFVGSKITEFLPRLCKLAAMREISLFDKEDLQSEKHPPGKTKEENIQEDSTIKIKLLLTHIANNFKLTTIVDNIPRCYEILQSCHEDVAMQLGISRLMQVLSILLDNVAKNDVRSFEKLLAFYKNALGFRSSHENLSLENIDVVEGEIMNSFIKFVIKRKDVHANQAIKQLHEWVCSDGFVFSRALTFYRLLSLLINKIQHFYQPHCSVVLLDHMAQTMKMALEDCTESGPKKESTKLQALSYLVRSLKLVFIHCGKNFIDRVNADIITQPLVNQLEVMSSNSELIDSYINDDVIRCIAEMTINCGDDVNWMNLNDQIVQKFCHHSQVVRIRAPLAILKVAEVLGDDYNSAVQDVLPKLQELVEYGDEAVETQAAKIMKIMEEKYKDEMDYD